MGKRSKKQVSDEMTDGPSITQKVVSVSKASKVIKPTTVDVDMSGANTNSSNMDKLRAAIEDGRQLSKKAKKKLAAARTKEAAQAALAIEEAALPEEERTKREADRVRMDEIRAGKAQIAKIKAQIAKLGKRNLHEKERRKQLAKQIKAIQARIADLTSKRPAEALTASAGDIAMC